MSFYILFENKFIREFITLKEFFCGKSLGLFIKKRVHKMCVDSFWGDNQSIIRYPQIQTHQYHHPSHLWLLKNREE